MISCEFLKEVDRSLEEFAPILQLPAPDKTLQTWFAESHCSFELALGVKPFAKTIAAHSAS